MVELADMADSVDSEKQDAEISVDNVCYDKIHIKQGSGKNASVELTDIVSKSSVDNKEGEQNVVTSVDNSCYEKIPCKRGSEKDDAVEEAVMMDESSVDSKEQDKGTSVDNVCYDKIQSK